MQYRRLSMWAFHSARNQDNKYKHEDEGGYSDGKGLF